ncbi:MAG: ACP S-malonyltransferase [Oscillospiraceae bacterium]|nr:ACP S-malonyltransferase [Oscillospiraceae bacterium]
MVHKKAFLFPGQGSQYIGMGKRLCERYDIAKRTFEEANDALGFSLSDLCFKGDIAELTLTKNAQPAILTASVATFRVLEEKGIRPEILAGHSLGEISALTCAGVFSFADAVRLAQQRGALMQDAVPAGQGAMAAVITRDIEMLEEICTSVRGTEILSISNFNSKTQQVISGHVAAVERAVEKLNEAGIKTKLLNVSAPFHCALMEPAAKAFKEVLQGYEIRQAEHPVIANINAKPYGGPDTVIDALVKQIVSPVQWTDTMTYLKKAMIKYCVEVGSGHVLKNMMKTNISDIPVYAFEEEEEALYQHFESCKFPIVSRAMGIAVATRNSNWDTAQYEQGVVAPYKEMTLMQQKIEQEERRATQEETDRAISLLLTIFRTKGTPAQEQVQRLRQLFEDCGRVDLLQSFDYSMVGG